MLLAIFLPAEGAYCAVFGGLLLLWAVALLLESQLHELLVNHDLLATI